VESILISVRVGIVDIISARMRTRIREYRRIESMKEFIVHLQSFRVRAKDLKDAEFWAKEAIEHMPTYNIEIEDIEEDFDYQGSVQTARSEN